MGEKGDRFYYLRDLPCDESYTLRGKSSLLQLNSFYTARTALYLSKIFLQSQNLSERSQINSVSRTRRINLGSIFEVY